MYPFLLATSGRTTRQAILVTLTGLQLMCLGPLTGSISYDLLKTTHKLQITYHLLILAHSENN